MSVFYSQHGEDFLLDEIFEHKADGYYVEIGCLDGIELSNTYFFEKRGWQGACIEAHNDFIDLLVKNRPAARVVHCAVGEENKEEVTFYTTKGGSLSTLDKTEEVRWRKHYKEDFFGFEEQRVSMRTLTNIFDELKPPHIDFISLDIEGYEVKALKGLDLSKYRPTVFVIEYKNREHKKQLEDILLPWGYFFISKLGGNLLYSLRRSDALIAKKDYGVIDLLRIDQQGRELHHQFWLSPLTLLDRIRRIYYWTRSLPTKLFKSLN